MEMKLSLPIFLIREGEYITAYAPHLELSGYGKSEEDAMLSIDQCVEMFFEEVVEKGTLLEVMNKLGWRYEEVGKTFLPPEISVKDPPVRSFERRDKLFRISA